MVFLVGRDWFERGATLHVGGEEERGFARDSRLLSIGPQKIIQKETRGPL